MNGVTYTIHDTVAVIALDNPPVNALSLDVRRAVVAALDRAAEDDRIRAVVLIGAGKHFCAGADIREFDSPKLTIEPEVRTVAHVIEESTKPVIAAIAGVCLGGGLELAIGCHFRLAKPEAEIGLPEVKLGVLPGGGGTQRLPRIIGVETALNMIVSGTIMRAGDLKATALLDELAEGNLLEAALAFADKTIQEKLPIRRVRDIKISYPDAEAFFQFARNTVRTISKNLPAPLKCIDAVEASVTKPFEEGISIESEISTYLVQTPEARAQRHAFLAERAAAKIPDVPENTAARRVERVAVIGAGTMGPGISMNFLNAGIPVTVLEIKQEALDKGVATIRRNYESAVKRNRLTPQQVKDRMALLTTTLSYADLKDSDLVIEAVFENLPVKEQVFKTLDECIKQGAILATNTSTLDVNRIAGFTRRPHDVIGMHFFSPAHVMKLLEVVRGASTAGDVLATVMRLAKRINKTAVVSGVCDGFIGNRMIKHYERQAGYLVEEGATPQQVDKALERWGMAMGPFRMGDLAGNDISWAIRKRLYVEQPELKFPGIADRLCEMGRHGQKTGAGWYRYEPGTRDPIPDPIVDELVVNYRKEMGITPRRVNDTEIVQRCIFALVNEGARILEEGIAARASDIDLVYLAGYGFPLHRGGPMFYAGTVGFYNVVRAMKGFARARSSDAVFWKPAPLLAKLAEDSPQRHEQHTKNH